MAENISCVITVLSVIPYVQLNICAKFEEIPSRRSWNIPFLSGWTDRLTPQTLNTSGHRHSYRQHAGFKKAVNGDVSYVYIYQLKKSLNISLLNFTSSSKLKYFQWKNKGHIIKHSSLSCKTHVVSFACITNA